MIALTDVTPGTELPQTIVEQCVRQASSKFHFDPALYFAILTVEHGRNGTVSYNKGNGSYDLGIAQVNTVQFKESWYKSEYSEFTWRDVANIPCLNIEVGARVLKQRISELKSGQSVWNAVGHYHSRTGKRKLKYLQLVMDAYYQRAKSSGTGFNITHIGKN